MKINVYDFIIEANAEFNKNGRSERFVAMENKAINTKNIITLYFFARYTKGVDVAKIQQEFVCRGNLDDCLYFALFVPGAEVMPFLDMAIAKKDWFWIEKFIDVGETKGQLAYGNVKSRIKDGGVELEKRTALNLDTIIQLAKNEFAINGYSDKFKQYERKAIYAIGNRNIVLWASYVPESNLRLIEKSAIMRGDPSIISSLVKEVSRINKESMLKACKMTKLDYIAIEKDRAQSDKDILQIKSKLAEPNTKDVHVLKERLRLLENRFTYLDLVDVEMYRIKDVILQDRAKRK